MAIIPRLLFVLVLIVAPIVVYATSAGLPERVATHFGPAGVANGWMSRETYLAFMLAMTTLLPLFVVAMTGFFRASRSRRSGSPIASTGSPPTGAPKRSRGSRATRAGSASCCRCSSSGCTCCSCAANAVRPARLDEPLFFTLLAAFVVLLFAWIVAMTLRFRRAL